MDDGSFLGLRENQCQLSVLIAHLCGNPPCNFISSMLAFHRFTDAVPHGLLGGLLTPGFRGFLFKSTPA